MGAAADNSSWLSLVAEEEVEAPPLTTLEEVIAFRAAPSRDLTRHNVDLPEGVGVEEAVVLGEVDGRCRRRSTLRRAAGPSR
jgi:hypothetical protein